SFDGVVRWNGSGHTRIVALKRRTVVLRNHENLVTLLSFERTSTALRFAGAFLWPCGEACAFWPSCDATFVGTTGLTIRCSGSRASPMMTRSTVEAQPNKKPAITMDWRRDNRAMELLR